MANFVTGIISLTLGIVLLANVFIQTVKATNQSATCVLANTSVNASAGATYVGTCNWTAGEIALWGLLALGAIAGMVYGTLAVFGLV